MESKNSIIYKKYRRLIVIKYCIIDRLLVKGINVKSQVGTLTVISNQKGAPGSMKLSELKSIMKGEQQRWKGGTKVTVAIMKTNTPAGEKTAQVIYNMSGNALLKFFLDQSYQGISYTNLFNNISDLENYVAQNPGAIGVIDQPLSNNEIKIITIDGKTQFNL
jgi:ABC-type phosphate transport system substrate-binding protein